MRITAALALLTAGITVALHAAPATPPPKAQDPSEWSTTERALDEVRRRQHVDSPILKTEKLKQAVLDYKPGAFPDLAVTWAEFVTIDGTEFIAWQLAPVSGSNLKPGARVVAFGELVDAKGRADSSFEEPVTVEESKKDVFVERTTILKPGTFTVTAGVAAGGEIVGMARFTIEPETLTKASSGISRLILSDNLYPLPAAQKPLDPFAFGGMKVVPKPGRVFKKSDELWVFAELLNPSVGADGNPKAVAKIEVTGATKKGSAPFGPVEASPLKGVAGHFGIGQTIDLSRYPAGDYALRYTLRDTIADKTYVREETFHVVD